ncbi:TetR/AcrR family transcriptional regulator [Mycetocola zhujimingii]|uniref:TetR family transcriptional regulator n=1 Tax=Mycetocola zhujimingii TaxID=2079792 RepID=A0A2U1TCR8_9MICO|nr:TetR/AcrR family transcriptional regulator [Mycetocola zhujimingii]PWC06674.1 TetR family transcriptional regulator [Mycetocola zhujimingii]
MRADAARRRQRIVHEARRIFAAHGGAVALETIAEASGVGIATFYRNFESRAALADEVALSILSDIQEAAAKALAGIHDSPAGAWESYVKRLVTMDLGALTEALSGFVRDEMSAQLRDAQATTLIRVDQLLAAAHDAGLVRRDISALELIIAIGMITRPLPDMLHAAAPDLREKLVEVFIRGVRPGT